MISNIEPPTAPGQARPVTLKEIEASCEVLASARTRAEKLMARVEKERQAILDKHADELKAVAHDLAEARSIVTMNVEYGREFFKKPKTQTFHGIVVGFEKERDKLMVPEESILIQRIETLLKAKASALVRNVKSVIAEAFKNLTIAEKQMLGCRTVSGADKVVVRAESKSDVEKYFAACVTSAATESDEVKA